METTIINLEVKNNVEETKQKFDELNVSVEKTEGAVDKVSASVERNTTAVNQQTAATSKQGTARKQADAVALTGGEKVNAVFKAGIQATNVGAQAFTAYKGVMGMIGVESENLQKTMVQVQSVMAMSQGIKGLIDGAANFKKMGKVAVTALQGVKGAIAATGIGLLVIALGTIVAYWDDIKAAVGGVSKAQQKLNEESKANYETQVKKLDAIGGQENILKLQGKSERDILQIKLKQTDEAIKALEISIEQAKSTKKAQVEAAVRNKAIAMGIIAFLTAPITLLLGMIDSITYGLSLLGVMDATSLTEDFLGGTANLMFDPSEVAEEGDKVIDEQQEALDKLKNDRAGIQLKMNEGDKKSATDRSNIAKESAKDLLQFERDYWDSQQAMVKEGYEKDKDALEEKYKRLREDIARNEKYTAEQKKLLIAQQKINEGIELANLETENNKKLEEIKEAYFDTIIEATKNQAEREIAENNEKYRRLIEDTERDERFNAEQKASIIAMYEQQKIDAEIKINNERKQRELDDNKTILTAKALFLEDELNAIKNSAEQKKILFEELQANKLKQAEIERDNELLNLDLTEAQKFAIIEEYNNKVRDLETETAVFLKELDEQSASERQGKIEAILDVMADGLNAMSQLVAMNSEKQVKSINKRYDKEKEAAKGNTALLNKIELKRVQDLNKANKKAFEAKKKADLAIAVMDGYKAVLSTYASTPGGPILKGIAAGISGLFAAMNIAKIAASKFEGETFQPANAPTSDGANESGVTAPSFNIVGNTGVNQLNGLGAQAPIEAFVVSGAITTQQQLDRDRITNATL